MDTSGRLIGINTAIYSRTGGSLGIGFAIPSSTVQDVMNQIIKHGRVIRGYIGVEPQDVTPELAEAFRLPRRDGAIIAGIMRGGPAEKAGVKVGDILTSMDGKPVTNVTTDAQHDLAAAARLHRPLPLPARCRRGGSAHRDRHAAQSEGGAAWPLNRPAGRPP